MNYLTILLVVVGLVVVVGAVVVYACCCMSGECSREDEQRDARRTDDGP